MSQKENNTLQITDAFENNLKHIDVTIPHNALTVITGVSGSGKSSLAYSVIFKESQRRFLDSFSAYSRQYLGKLEKPKVKEIKGLQAALAINQTTGVANPRSTVGTMSGIYDYLRLLFARMGTVYCTECHTLNEEKKATHCPHCGTEQPRIQASLFSFNSKQGACPNCNGLGVSEQIDQQKLIADPNRTLREGALVPTTPNGYIVYSQVRVDELNKVCAAHGFSVDIPWKNLTQEQQNVIMFGSEKIKILFGKHGLESRLKWKGITAKPREEAYYKGMIPIMEEILKRDRNDNILRFASAFTCNHCHGSRLRKEALSVLIKDKNISELSECSLFDLSTELKNFGDTVANQEVLENILNHVYKRLEYLDLLGLNYLTLARESTTLSGGESQRIRLASQVGSGLQGILYILDEPSIGLHARDNKKLLEVLKSLRNNGNTVLVVEHDEETIRNADYLIDIGPKAGFQGGQVLFQGSPQKLFSNKTLYPASVTAQTLSAKRLIKPPQDCRHGMGMLEIRGAQKHNLKNIDIDFKLGAFNAVTGVSGAGKSTLVHHILAKHLMNGDPEIDCRSLNTTIPVTRIIEIDQSPIGRTPRSNPATYTDLFDHIRDLFANLAESKKRHYKKGRFSFNNMGGRCEACQGAGSIQLGMHFLGDVEIVCDQCNGKRFNDETLEIQYKDKNIFEVLELSIEEAVPFFEGQVKIQQILDQLIRLDVGYLKLGQPSTTLSGGEAQRVKLASELYKTSKGHTLYILDEPTVGLHKADIRYLLDALNNIVENQNTVIVIEHDPDVIGQADWVVDLGPESGENGGNLVKQGNPTDLMNFESSHIGRVLREHFGQDHSVVKIVEKEVTKNNIRFYGVSTHNLKHIDVEIPLNKTTVITGISGSGKSSLAFDTLYSESRNRFTEGLSTYARRMMSKIKKPELEQCSGLTPAIAIRQSRFKKNLRSTVGTATEIYDLYRLLFSRVGKNQQGVFTHLPASMFSFNKPEAACEVCKGIGIQIVADPEKFITHPEKAITAGAMDGTLPGKYFGDIHGQHINTLLKVGEVTSIDFTLPFNQLTPEAKEIALYGTGDKTYEVEWKFKRGNRTGIHRMTTKWKGMAHYFTEEYELKRDGKRGEAYHSILSERPCPACHGDRLRPQILEVSFDGFNISQLSGKSIKWVKKYFEELSSSISPVLYQRCDQIVFQLVEKLATLENIGLGYLTADRSTATLSGGEGQRMRIATQLVSELCGLTYILDEPTIGLHSRNTQNLMQAINQLKDNGNTIVLVEHDPEVILQADHIIDLGPGAGVRGGEIIARGTVDEIKSNHESVTGRYLNKIRQPKQKVVRKLGVGIEIKKASANNLKHINLHIPLGGIVAVTGVSGSGKTSLVFDVISNSWRAGRPVNCTNISFNPFDDLLIIDQQRIGTSPLSTPATYTGVFDVIRDLFASLPKAKSSGLKKSHFSFNSPEGRCESCKGMGQVKVSMDFLSDVWVSCESCHGTRYKPAVLEIKLNNLNISEVLNLEIGEALSFFKTNRKINDRLKLADDIGLGYLKLGQPTSTLSGGETQRIKLATELMQETKGRCLFIFDEPSTGLHMQDVEKLVAVFNQLVNSGNSVLVVEHNQEIIGASNWIVELGPEGGDEGGLIVYEGVYGTN